MPDSLEQAVVDSTLRVFETAAFMAIWLWSEEDGELPAPDTVAVMAFHGPVNGRLTLRVSSSVLPALASNMVGDMEGGDSTTEKGLDALREVLNMICGNLLTSWYGEDVVFELDPPGIVPIEAMPPASSASTRFAVEGTLAEVDVAMADEAVSEAASPSSRSLPEEH